MKRLKMLNLPVSKISEGSLSAVVLQIRTLELLSLDFNWVLLHGDTPLLERFVPLEISYEVHNLVQSFGGT